MDINNVVGNTCRQAGMPMLHYFSFQKKEEGSYGNFRYPYRGNVGKKCEDVS